MGLFLYSKGVSNNLSTAFHIPARLIIPVVYTLGFIIETEWNEEKEIQPVIYKSISIIYQNGLEM